MRYTSKILNIFLATALLVTSTSAQDIEGGTGVIIAPPKNPVIRRRAPVRASQQSRPAQSRPTAAVTNNTTAPTNIPTTTITNSKVPVAKSDPEVVATTTVPRVNENKELVASMPTIADQVEEALEQGNAARDASPPRYAEAERAYKKAAVLDSKDARAFAGLGNVYYDQRLFPDAEINFRRATELDGKDADAYRYLAFSYIKNRKFQDAERSARRALDLDPQNFYGYSALGWAQFRLKNYAEAEASYQKAINLSPQTFGLYSDLGLFMAQQGRYKDAIVPYRKALELNPTFAPALANYGVVMQKLWKLGDAEDAFVRFIKFHDPANIKTAPVRSNLALVYYHKGDTAKAAEQWATALRLGSTSPLDKAGQLIVSRQYMDARFLLEPYVRSNSGDENGWLLLGDAIAARGDKKLAQKAYDNAARVAPLTRGLPRPKI